jgi:hypothetical protein
MSDLNPYEAVAIAPPIRSEDSQEERVFVWWKSILVWMLVCWISAAPSFFIATGIVNVQRWPALVAGVLTFVAGYIFADYRTSRWKFRQRKPVRYALITTYVIRMVISVIFPIAFIVDMMCGMVSSIVLYPIGLDVPKHDLSIGAVYLWTVAQGAVLNVVLGIVWAVLFAIFALAMGPDPVTHEE